MHALIVVAHPDTQSLSHCIAAQVAEGLSAAGHSPEIADLAAEGFDPRFSLADNTAYRNRAPRPADVVAEQARVDRADALVLVYPIYWWSMPGLLKGWIDRVFTNGWAYDYGDNGKVIKKLRGRRVHLIGVGAADAGTYERHGYFDAMKTQIDHGIFDYCGALVSTSEFLLDADVQEVSAQHLISARAIGRKLFDAVERHDTANAA